MTLKLNKDNGLQRWTDRRPTGNMRLAQWRVKCLNSSSVVQINFSAGLTVLCSEIPHERQAQNRYTTTFTILPGTKMNFFTGLPSIHFWTVSSARTNFSTSSLAAVADTVICALVFPLTETG